MLMNKTLPTSTLLRALTGLTFAAFALPSALQAQTTSPTYHFMAAENFSEDFALIANTTTWATPIKVGGSWSGFTATGTGTIPNPNRTTTNSSVFITGTSGGIQRGTAQTPSTQSIIFLSTGGDNASATALDLLLNFTNRTAGSLSFDAATIFNSTGNRQGTLSVYASIDGSTWTALTGTGLPYVATNNVEGSASVNVTLPASFNNQPEARLRFYYNNNATTPTPTPAPSGSRPKISVDNVSVTSTSSLVNVPEITSARTGSGTAGSSYSYTIAATQSPTAYAAQDLPDGLSFNTTTGTISGTPTLAGVYRILLSATNANGTGYAYLHLTVDVNANAPVVDNQTTTGTINQPFSYQIAASNGATSYSTSTLPPGLSLDSATGLISGTPTSAGYFGGIQITATNASGSDGATLVIQIEGAPILTGSFSGSIYLGETFAYTITASPAPQAPAFYDATGLPSEFTYDGVNAISGTPTAAGTYTFSLTAGNMHGSDVKTFTLRVVDPAEQDALPLNVVINKYVNGTPDKVELLVVGTGAGSTVDMRGMVIKDFSSSMGTDNGGKYEFSASNLWSSVPAGTLIVLSAGNTETIDADSSDYVVRANLGDEVYFTSLKVENPGNSAAFDIATTELMMIKPAGYGALGVAGGIHAMGGGNAGTLYTAFTGPKLLATGTSGASIGVIANNSTSTLADYEGADATGGVVLASLPFGAANNATNQVYIDSLRGGPTLSAIEQWRLDNFGSADNTGTAADSADYDGDGIPNLIEYATGTEPDAFNVSAVTSARSGDFLTLSYPTISDPSLTYVVQASSDLAAGFGPGTGSSSTVGSVTTYTDDVSLSTAGVRRFLRLSVTRAE